MRETNESIELFSETSGRWRWRYRAEDVALESNEDYADFAEAEKAARTAYPGLAISRRDESENEQTGSSGALGWLALALVIVVLLRARKSR